MIINYANGFQETRSERLERILPVLACTRCQGPLETQGATLHCQRCGADHPIKGGVPVLLPIGVQDGGAMGLSEQDRVSRHPYSVRAEEIIADTAPGWVLDLGAGGKLDRRQNVVQIDIFRYPAVDVVGSADCLPFLDNSFDAVISQAVFEHLQYPEWAVSEIRRVLKPGGIAKVDTAFLQPEHGYPHHFYNATETGLLHWFRDFDIQWSGVEPFQHPKWALHWFLGVYLDYIGVAEADVLRKLTVGNLLDTLQRHSTQETTDADLLVTNALDALPNHFLRVLAAGVSVQAINPPKHEMPWDAQKIHLPSSLDREREMAQLRAEKSVLNFKAQALQESLKLSQDKAEYLSQFYPSACNLAQFAAAWADPMHLRQIDRLSRSADVEDETQPFAKIIVCPTAISPLLDTFFSLINQSYGGWTLLLVLDADVAIGVGKAAQALCRLDQRVVILTVGDSASMSDIADSPVHPCEYWMRLPEGATLASNALREIVTVARNLPGTFRIGFDFDRTAPGAAAPLRCYAQLGSDMENAQTGCLIASPCFTRSVHSKLADSMHERDKSDAHIPQSLVHLEPFYRDGGEAERAGLFYLLEQYREVSAELQQMNVESPTAARELRQLNIDVANYLAQFYFDSNPVKVMTLKEVGPFRLLRQLLGRWVRGNVPVGTLSAILQWKSRPDSRLLEQVASSEAQPFVSLVIEPENAIALIGTFFSLVHQSYSGWELIVIETIEQSPAIRRAISDFSKLDKRVVVSRGLGATDDRWRQAQKLARGKYSLKLIDGITLAFNAIEQVVTLLKAAPGTHYVVCDFDCVTQAERLPMRCYNFTDPSNSWQFVGQVQFTGTFVRTSASEPGSNSARTFSNTAHIPLCLFHQLRPVVGH